ncbi:MAG: hypothetical protein EXR67_00075 [Dehalococcoidia bacterium]|nr:hypothetical protein [Dehalococcoidia bacterium]
MKHMTAHHLVEFHNGWKLHADPMSGAVSLCGKITVVAPYTCPTGRGTAKIGNTTVHLQLDKSVLQHSQARTYEVTCSGRADLSTCPPRGWVDIRLQLSDGTWCRFEHMVDIHS